MSKEYTKNQIWELFKQLPEELKDAIFSEKTADEIYNACESNNVKKEKISEIAKLTGNVMLGILPPDELQQKLEKEIALKPDTAKKVFSRIHRFVFFPIKNELEKLYKITSAPKKSSDAPAVKKTQFALKADSYREPLE